jgi:hypothetical protein
MVLETENKHILYNTETALPAKQNNYETAYREAADKLSHSSIMDIAQRSGATIIETQTGKALTLPFLGVELLITHPDVSIRNSGKNEEVPLWAKIVALHYLNAAGGDTLTGRQITFQDLEGGRIYSPAFMRRTITPLLNEFRENLEGFEIAGLKAGGTKATIGDHSLSFQAFPFVSLTFALWKGDNEFPASGSVIFDSSIASYLSSEDIAVLCNMIAIKIMKNKPQI